MRLKHVWAYVPLPIYAKTFWERITFSRLTVIYLGFSVLHFLVQFALQIRAFTINDHSFQILLAQLGNTNIDGLPFYSNSTLQMCKWVPSNLSLQDGNCTVVWPRRDGPTAQKDNTQPPSYYKTTGPTASTALSPIPILSPTGLSIIGISPLPPPTSSFPASDIISISASTIAIAQDQTTPVIGPTLNAPAADPDFTSISLSPSIAIPQTPSAQATTTAITSQTSTTTVFVVGTSAVSAVRVSTTSQVPVTGESSDDTDESDPEGNEGPDAEKEKSNDGDNRGSDDDENDTDTIEAFLKRDEIGATTSTDPVCLQALSYPLSILGNTKREDIVFIAFQFWVLGMSVVALLNQSIPHIFASLLTHVMATAWGGFQLAHTAEFRNDFMSLITMGACARMKSNLPISSAYWEARKAAEASSLVLNALALLVSCFLSWKLFKLFGWQTFKRVGASLVINRMYKLVLILSITIQLSLFFMAVAVSLWLDRLVNNVIGDLADFRKVYMAASIITLLLLVPWLMMGWFGVTRELRIPMLTFLIFCVGYLGGWSIMFVSTTFRWTFSTWTFFSIIASLSVALTVACLILGLLCRMNFGKGLPRYLNAQDKLPGEDFGIVTPEYGDIEKYDDDKIEFPSTEKPMPTFGAAYGNNFTTRGHVFITNGPRFYNQSGIPVVLPPQALTRTPSGRSTNSYSSVVDNLNAGL